LRMATTRSAPAAAACCGCADMGKRRLTGTRNQV
jgi:hypothetical protein